MSKDRLKPYVYKIKGAKNYALYDLFYGKFYQIIPEGNLSELRSQLLAEGLIFKTEGVVPYKIKIALSKESTEFYIKELQIKLDGVKEDSCWSRKITRKTGLIMKNRILDKIIEQVKYINLYKIRIESDDYNEDLIKKLISLTLCSEVEIYSKKKISKKQFLFLKNLCKKSKKNLVAKKIKPFDLSELDVRLYNFFYSQEYNPCLGHQVAIDTNGSIKPCLWLNEIIGNIEKDNINDLIVSGKFEKYWNLSKDSIDDCKLCEMRYACNDCRVSSEHGDFSKENKPIFCKYDPHSGTYYD